MSRWDDSADALLYKACAIISDHRMWREERGQGKTAEAERRANPDAFLDSLGDDE